MDAYRDCTHPACQVARNAIEKELAQAVRARQRAVEREEEAWETLRKMRRWPERLRRWSVAIKALVIGVLIVVTIVLISTVVVLWSNRPREGQPGGTCYGNRTCDPGAICQEYRSKGDDLRRRCTVPSTQR